MNLLKSILLSTIFLTVISNVALTQDKIITLQNDTIDCKIFEINNNDITFRIAINGLQSTGVVAQSEIQTYLLSAETILSLSKSFAEPLGKEEKTKDFSPNNKQRFSIQVYSGYGYLTSSSSTAEIYLIAYGFDPTLVKSYYKGFRNTILSGASVQYALISSKQYALSFGINYMNQLNSSSIAGSVDIGDGVHLQYGSYREQVYVNHYGILLRHTIYNKTQKMNIYLESSNGLASYRNENHFINYPVLLKAYSPGVYSKLGFESVLTKHLSLNIDAGYYLSIFKDFTLNNGFSVLKMTAPDGEYESLGKITMQVGMSYKF